MTAHVIVKFEGLMVFHRSRITNHYEVGILISDHDHELSIAHTQSGTLKPIRASRIADFKRQGNHWFLDVINRPRVDVEEINSGHRDRQDATPDARQFDVSWIIDIESAAFHGPIGDSMQAGKLMPILHLSNGRLSTFCKTFKLKRRKGPRGREETFGFITETMALSIDFNSKESVALRVRKSDGSFQNVFHLAHTDGFTHRVNIANTAPHPGGSGRAGDPSHFQLYYRHLFPSIGPNDKFELIAPRKPGEEDFPPNICIVKMEGLNKAGKGHKSKEDHKAGSREAPTPIGPLTVNPFKCGGIHLSERQRDLD